MTPQEDEIKLSKEKLKIVCVLYDDPVDGYPPKYARADIPKITKYPGGQTTPSPEEIDFKPGELLGCVSGELGLRKFLEVTFFLSNPIVHSIHDDEF